MVLAIGKVFNENKHPLNDEFKGRKILIEPGKSVDMDYFDYVAFKGEPPVGFGAADWKDGTGAQKAETFKMLRYEGPLPHENTEASKVCAACGDKFPTDTQLDLHIDMNHLDEMEDAKVADKRKANAKGR